MRKSDLNTINGRFRQIRIDNGLTQEEMGERIGLTRMGVNAIELNRYDPVLSTITAIKKKFGVTYDYIIDGAVMLHGDTVVALKARIAELESIVKNLEENNRMLIEYNNLLKK